MQLDIQLQTKTHENKMIQKKKKEKNMCVYFMHSDNKQKILFDSGMRHESSGSTEIYPIKHVENAVTSCK